MAARARPKSAYPAGKGFAAADSGKSVVKSVVKGRLSATRARRECIAGAVSEVRRQREIFGLSPLAGGWMISRFGGRVLWTACTIVLIAVTIGLRLTKTARDRAMAASLRDAATAPVSD